MIIAVVTLLTEAARALDVSAFYIGSCRRVVGVPLKVTSETVEVLSIDGDTVLLPRHEINLLATYPAGSVPFKRIEKVKTAQLLSILTWRDRKMVEIVRGWPVEFTEDKIAFLTLSGRDVVLDRRSIWRIDVLDAPEAAMFSGRAVESMSFLHPQILANCKLESSGAGARVLVAYQLLSEPVTIKRELDRLQRGHELVDTYIRKQSFFPVPALFSNTTSLQLWTSIGSRYGSSQNRSNNFTPFVKSEHWSGPFLYQHQFLTGSGPHLHSLHDEPQTLAAYQFKADYIQFGVMSDLQFMLIGGEKYRWRAEDVPPNDMRLNDVARLFAAIDYGAFSLILLSSSANVGMRAANAFAEDGVDLPRVGLSYRAPDLYLDFTAGSDQGNKLKLTAFRANARYQLNALTQLTASYIQRSAISVAHENQQFTFDFKSQTVAAWIEHLHRGRFPMGGFLSVESVKGSFSPFSVVGGTETKDAVYIKTGVMVGINF